MNIATWVVMILVFYVGISVLLLLGGALIAMVMVPFIAVAERLWPSDVQLATNEGERRVKESIYGRLDSDSSAQRTRQSHRPL